jgi:hypothetical protein
MYVKLAFEQFVYGIIETKGRHGRACNTKALIQIEAPWALTEEVNFAAAYPVRLARVGLETVFRVADFILLLHYPQYSIRVCLVRELLGETYPTSSLSVCS